MSLITFVLMMSPIALVLMMSLITFVLVMSLITLVLVITFVLVMSLIALVLVMSELVSITALLSHDYYMKLVPTIYQPVSGDKLSGYQYTYAYKVGHVIYIMTTFHCSLLNISYKVTRLSNIR